MFLRSKKTIFFFDENLRHWSHSDDDINTYTTRGGRQTKVPVNYCCYKVIYSNSARFRLHHYFFNLPLQYAVLSIIIYFTFTLTLYR